MVIETLIKPTWVFKNPFYAFYLGITLAFIGTSIGLFIFPDQASFAGLLFITIAAVPFLQKVVDYELERGKPAKAFWRRNKKIALIYGLFFFGVALTYFIWFKVLPPQAALFFFNRQIVALTQPTMLGFFTQTQLSQFSSILLNNLKILTLVLILSFIYGMGSILIITWNASVLGVFVGSFGKFVSFLAFVPHTALEFVGFFFGAMAGGLLNMAFDESKTKLGREKFYMAINDAALLFLLATIIIIAAAAIEIRLL
ncbi:MAG: stage II sporulation protein M [Candidatus Nanoarchaeia archaeon]